VVPLLLESKKPERRENGHIVSLKASR